MAYVQALHCDVIIAGDHQFCALPDDNRYSRQTNNKLNNFSQLGCVVAPDAADVCSH